MWSYFSSNFVKRITPKMNDSRYKEFALYRGQICRFKGKFCRGQKFFALYRGALYRGSTVSLSRFWNKQDGMRFDQIVALLYFRNAFFAIAPFNRLMLARWVIFYPPLFIFVYSRVYSISSWDSN
jgi:hypothetical protein